MNVVSDDLWVLIEPVMPSGRRRGGRPWNDHRRTLEGIIWRHRTGSPWRDLPEEFGAWQSVAERHLRWSVDGTYAKIFAAVQVGLGQGGVVTTCWNCCGWTPHCARPPARHSSSVTRLGCLQERLKSPAAKVACHPAGILW